MNGYPQLVISVYGHSSQKSTLLRFRSVLFDFFVFLCFTVHSCKRKGSSKNESDTVARTNCVRKNEEVSRVIRCLRDGDAGYFCSDLLGGHERIPRSKAADGVAGYRHGFLVNICHWEVYQPCVTSRIRVVEATRGGFFSHTHRMTAGNTPLLCVFFMQIHA